MRRGLTFARLGMALVALWAGGCRNDKSTPPPAKVASSGTGSDAGQSRLPDEPAQILIDDVVVKRIPGKLDYPLYEEQLAQHIGRQLAGSGYFFALPNETDPMQPSRRARVEVSLDLSFLPEGSSGAPSLLVAVEAKVTWLGEKEPLLRENLLGERPVDDVSEAERPLVAAAHVARTVEEACAGLIAQEKLRAGDDAALAAALANEDGSPNLLRFALLELGRRRPPGAVELAARFLSSKHPELRNVAFSTLVAIGDPAAVDPMTKAASFDDHDAMRAVIEAVSVLGGRDAIDYLEFVAAGHPSDEIKKRAQDALRELRRRK